MACKHLNQLFRLCREHRLHFSGTDLIRIVCKECSSEETCPSILLNSRSLDVIEEDADSSLPGDLSEGDR